MRAVPLARAKTARRPLALCALICAISTVALPALPAASSPPASSPTAPQPALLTNPPGFFHLADCGSGRPADSTSHVGDLKWKELATNFELTILENTRADYRKLIKSVVRRDPDHRMVFQMPSHGVYSREDRAGVLDLFETNFVHSTDPASVRVIPTEGGLLVDWERDERSFYDEHGTISEAREFTVNGYAVYRAVGDGPLERVWPEEKEGKEKIELAPPNVTQFLDSLVVAGEHYRYEVRTVGPMHREYAFSGEIAATAGAPQPVPFVHEHQSVIQGAPGDSTYLGRFRAWVETPDTRAVIRIDANADHDFDEPNETIPMKPSTERWVEAIVTLEAADHTDLDIDTIFGFGYQLEFETDSGERLVLPETGVYTTNINNRVRDARRGFYLVQMNSSYWIENAIRILEFDGARRDGPVGGALLEELIFDPVAVADAMPVDLTAENMARGAIDLVAAIRGERPDLAIYYSVDQSGEDRLPSAELADSLVGSGITGSVTDGFAVAPWHGTSGGAPGIAAPETWRQQMAAAESTIGRGEEALLLALGPLDQARPRLFALGSYLLVRAPATLFAYTPDRCQSPALPEWGVDLGDPLTSREFVDDENPDHYRRQFERGAVWVNPSESRRRVAVDPPGFRLQLEAEENGRGRVTWEWVDEVELAPQSAAIVARPVAAPTDRESEKGPDREG